MNMKIKVFLAHDPGGYDVVYPVFKRYQGTGLRAELYCVGPAAKLNPDYAITEQEFRRVLSDRILPEMSLLVTGTSWGTDFELQVIQLCKSAGIKTVSILDYWSNYALRLRNKQATFMYPDYFIVMDTLAKQEAIQDGVPEKLLYELGHPGLDRFMNKKISVNNKNSEDKPDNLPKRALFLCQPLSQLYGDTLGYTESSALTDCQRVFTLSGWAFDVKFHPKDTEEIRRAFLDQSIDGDLIDLIPQYDLIVGMNSMGLLHSILLGVPAISFQPNLCQADLCITNKLGLTPLYTSCDELTNSLLDDHLITHLQNNISNAKKQIPWLDGQSTDRIFHFIEGL